MKTNPEMLLAEDIGRFSHDPLGFVRYAFPWGSGELSDYKGPEPWQVDILSTIAKRLQDGARHQGPIQIAVASGHGIGKSALVSWLILWAMSTHEDTRGVVTANTGDQLRGKTWAELGKWHRNAINKHWFDLKAESIACSDTEHTKTWRIDASTWSEGRTEAFAGLHNKGKRILIIYDEASAIPDAIWEVFEGATTDKDTEIIWVAFGNPTQNTGRFFQCFGKYRHRWTTRQIDSRTVSITNKEQIQQWVDDYGEDSDFVRVRVKGQFPRAANNQLIPADIVDAARKVKPVSHTSDPIVIGVDVARFGDDRSVIAIRQGLDAKTRPWREYRGLDTMQLASEAAGIAMEITAQGLQVAAIFVDGVGVGAGVADRLNQLGFPVIDVQSGAKSPDKRYFNLRAKMWCDMRDWLKKGGAIPDNQDLADDLIAPTYGYQSDMRIQLERKEDMRDRGLASPDYADALALTFAYPVGIELSAVNTTSRVVGYDYDPYDYL